MKALLIIAVALVAYRGGVTWGMVGAALAVVVLFAGSILFGAADLSTALAIENIGFTVSFLAIGFIVGRLSDRFRTARGAQHMFHEEVVDADERLLQVLESVTDGFVTVDANWRLTYVNRRAERILGRTRQHLIGRSALDAFPQSVGSRIHQELERARAEVTPIEFESWYAPGNRWFGIRAYPADDGGLTVYFRDITRRKQAEESLAVQARLLDAVGQAVIAVDMSGAVFYCNRAAVELFGWSEGEFVRKINISDLHAGSDLRIEELLRQATAARAWTGELKLLRRDGSTFPAHVSDSPIIDHDGTVMGMVRVANDASARHAEQHTQRLLAEAGAALAATLDYEHTLSTLLEFVVPALADCCIIDVVEPEGNARRIATAWSPELDIPGAHRLMRRVNAPAPSGAALLKGFEPILLTTVTEAALGHVTSDNSELKRLRDAGVRSVVVTPLNVGGRKLGTLTAIGITRSYNQSDLRLTNELARRAAFAIDNAVLYEAASMANQSKSDFLAVMSHELRTPLTTVMGYTDLLLAGVTAQLSQQSQTYVERIRMAAWHLLGLIEQILIYARLEVGREQVHVEKVLVARVMRDAAELIEPVASEKGLQFNLIEPPAEAVVETDATKLRQILLNLLSNAVKFTDAGGVDLEARVTDAYVQFLVHDTGVGIAPEHQHRVFDSFWQVDQSATRKEGGTGIGLSVSRKLAHLLGGDLTVRSTPRQGTTFTLSLPRSGLTRTIASA
jgi:PAS domain S-box-containing protein